MTFRDARTLIDLTIERITTELPAEDMPLAFEHLQSHVAPDAPRAFTPVVRAFEDLNSALEDYRANVLYDDFE